MAAHHEARWWKKYARLTPSDRTPIPISAPNKYSPGSAVSGQVGALWSAIKQKSVWLPAAFIFMWQATPSSDAAFLYFLTNDIGEDAK